MFKKLKLKNKQLYIWFFSYLIVVLLCITVSFMLYFTSANTLKNQIEQNMHLTLEQMRLFYDSDFLKMQDNTYSILQEPEVQHLASGNVADTLPARSRQYRQICNRITTTFHDTDILKNIYIVFENIDLVLDNKGHCSKQSLFDSYFSQYYNSMESWLSDMHDLQSYGGYKVLKNSKGLNNICYIQRTPVLSSANTKALAIIILDSVGVINERLSFVDSTDSVFTILGSNNEVIFSSASSDASEDIIYNRKHITTEANSAFCEWKYVLSAPETNIYEGLKHLQVITFSGYFLCILIGVFLAYYFAKKNYQPLERLVTKFSSDSLAPSESEYLYVERQISSLLENNKKINRQLDFAMPNLRQLYLSNLVLGHKEDKRKGSYREKFSMQNYTVVLFRVLDCGLLKEGLIHTEEELFSMYFVIENVLSEVTELIGKCYFFPCEGMCACIINSDLDNPELDICTQTEFTIKFLEENFATQILCAVSDTVTSEEQLPIIYRQAKDIISLGHFSKENSVLVSGGIEDSSYIYSHETEQILTTHLKHGDFNSAQKVLEDIFRNNQEKIKLSHTQKQILLYDLAGTLLKLSTKHSENRLFFANFIESIDTNDINRSKNTLLEYMRVLCADVKENNKNSDERIEQIIDFVHSNYSDPNLNVSYIANKFDITISHLSRYFKGKTGQVLSDYILKYRLEKARKLLEDKKCSITEVCEICGFYDTNAFTRSFKKIYGTTPGKYGKPNQN